MSKIDVSVQSYNKPESLIYSLLTLHKYCKDDIDVVWINDDKSDEGVVDKYYKLSSSNVLHPWKIKIRVNNKRMGWWVSFCRGRLPKYIKPLFLMKRMIWNLYNTGHMFVDENDLRYQWAINETDKRQLLVIHDDVQFSGRVTKILTASLNKQATPGIAGDLGQCWRCRYSESGCNPKKITSGVLPSVNWPLTREVNGDHKWACRINEWLALIDVKAARDISNRENIFFGNYDDDGDIGAFWFSRLHALGYNFSDPFIDIDERDNYYIHWDGGITGHSAWVDQGSGKNKYNPDFMASKILQEFDYEV